MQGKPKAFVYSEYGIERRHGHHEIDHIIPLGTCGRNPRIAQPWNAERKDRSEGYLHTAVCHSQMPLVQAQREIAKDWIAAYRRHFW